MTDTRGVCYIASREPYLSEAAASARSVRSVRPDMPIVVYAPSTLSVAPVFDEQLAFDDPTHDFADSLLSRERMPFERTLFLDSDTHVCASITPVFDRLDRDAVVVAQDPTRTGTCGHTYDADIPESFPQFNTGVIGYRDTDDVSAFFEQRNRLYADLDGVRHGLNQPSFRVAAYQSDIDIGTLPPEFNFRIGNVANAINYACGPVRVLHGRSCWWDPADVAERINATDERRVVVAKPRPVEVLVDGDRTVGQELANTFDRVQWAYQKRGAVSAMLTLGSSIKRRVVA